MEICFEYSEFGINQNGRATNYGVRLDRLTVGRRLAAAVPLQTPPTLAQVLTLKLSLSYTHTHSTQWLY